MQYRLLCPTFIVGLIIASVSALSVAVRAVDDVDPPEAPKTEKHAPDKRVMIISIDGLRPDLAMRAEMPHFRSLMKDGSFTMWAQTLPVGITLPSHTSMMTGVPLERHGVYWNDDAPIRKRKYEYPHVPTLFEWAKEKEYTTALVAGKYKMIALAREGSVDHLVLPRQPKRFGPDGKVLPSLPQDQSGLTNYDRQYGNDWIGAEAARVIKEHKPEVMMVHFPRVDSVGHSKGWGSPQQIEAIEGVDVALGLVFEAMREAGVFDNSMIIITADHGGMGTGHNGRDPRGLHIPWVIHGPGIRKNYDLTRHSSLVVNTMDTFGTAAWYLGLTFTADDEIEGKRVKEAFEPVVKPAEIQKSDAAKSDSTKSDSVAKDSPKDVGANNDPVKGTSAPSTKSSN